jgi:hypothetical protein
MFTSNPDCHLSPCEFTVPIKLNIPIEIEPQLVMKSAGAVCQKLPVYLQPNIHLEPEVRANSPVCISQNGHNKEQSQVPPIANNPNPS